MNRSLAFNGLKLDRQTSLIWDHLKDLYDKSKRSERTAVSILKRPLGNEFINKIFKSNLFFMEEKL